MRLFKNIRAVLLLVALSFCVLEPAVAQRARRTKPSAPANVLWRDPGDIASRNLLYGPGSPDLAPVAPFTFVKEDKSGESPKFEVRDAKGVEWRIKLGPEAQSETVATRLVWAVGYFVEEAYYLPEAKIENLPRL
jgi:hypothetical protein